jgi:hypothetical protein
MRRKWGELENFGGPKQSDYRDKRPENQWGQMAPEPNTLILT